jgi:hypothetical protein
MLLDAGSRSNNIEPTKDLKTRLQAHSHGQSSHTAKFKPCELITYLAFKDKPTTLAFEKYLNPTPEKPSPTEDSGKYMFSRVNRHSFFPASFLKYPFLNPK